MRKIITLFLGCLLLHAAIGQTKRKLISLYSQQHFYLNGGTRAMFGGVSRTSLKVELPANTIEWYYVFTTSPGKDVSSDISLFAQLTKAFDPSGITATAVNAILAPTGSNTADVYLLDKDNVDLFISKEDFKYGGTDSRKNFKDGVVQINDVIKGTYYLGLRNPSADAGVNVSIEVVAVVEEKSENQSEAQTYGSIGWKEYQNGDFDKCIEYSKKSLSMDSTLSWVQCNIALTYLVTGKGDAMDSYVKAISMIEKSTNPKNVFAVAINDIDDAVKKHGSFKDADIIRQLLMDKYNKY
jgi:hypothetical protein